MSLQMELESNEGNVLTSAAATQLTQAAGDERASATKPGRKRCRDSDQDNNQSDDSLEHISADVKRRAVNDGIGAVVQPDQAEESEPAETKQLLKRCRDTGQGSACMLELLLEQLATAPKRRAIGAVRRAVLQPAQEQSSASAEQMGAVSKTIVAMQPAQVQLPVSAGCELGQPQSFGGLEQQQQSSNQVGQTSAPPSAMDTDTVRILMGLAKLLVPENELATPVPSQVCPPVRTATLEQKLNLLSLQEKPSVAPTRKSDTRISVSVNHTILKLEPGKGLFEYNVWFNPECDAKEHCVKMLKENIVVSGGILYFDGTILFLPTKLPYKVTYMHSTHPVSGAAVKIGVIYKKKKSFGESIALYNDVLKRIMGELHFFYYGSDCFNPHDAVQVPRSSLQVLPGYVIAVDEYQDEIQLYFHTSHRILTKKSIGSIMSEIITRFPANYKEKLAKQLIGSSVVPVYNNKWYRIQNIDWQQTPASKFTLSNGEEMSYVEYYRRYYNLEIHETQQPILITKSRIRKEEDGPEHLSLIPELVSQIEMNNEIKNDIQTADTIAGCREVSPEEIKSAMVNFIENVNNNPGAVELTSEWGLSLSADLVNLTARVLPAEELVFRTGPLFAGADNAEWSGHALKTTVLEAVDLDNWLVIHTVKTRPIVYNFISNIISFGPKLGIIVQHPRVVALYDDELQGYIYSLHNNITENVQVVVVICSTDDNSCYTAIKKFCCTEKPVPCQVINYKLITNKNTVVSAVKNIALQIITKMGAILWAVHLPLEVTYMALGIDVYHNVCMKSVVAVVSSYNKDLTQWYSKVYREEMEHGYIRSLAHYFTSSLWKFSKENHRFPDHIIVYRNVDGDDQVKVTKKFEVPQLIKCLKNIQTNCIPQLTIIVCQKHNTRIFASQDSSDLKNPPPGTVVDKTITKSNNEFFLVSESVRQGTATPTHYAVIHNSSSIKMDDIQRLTYKMCHLYYGWPSINRLPAPLQYAHDLAKYVCELKTYYSSEDIAEKLFYL